MSEIQLVFILLLLAKLIAEIWLDRLNRRQVLRLSGAVPKSLEGMLDEATYRKSVNYTLAKNSFSVFENVYGAVFLAAVILSGALPAIYSAFGGRVGHAPWSDALFLIASALLISIFSLPLDWWAQFRLEERFGFNKSTTRLWITDKLKGSVVGFIIGFPLLWLLLTIAGWAGDFWWIWGFAVFFVFQLLMMVFYPMLIMPLFNKFSPLPQGELRDRLMELATRAGFKARTIHVMDGSRRSAHSNAFFTGFGRFRRIVLYDTLIEQMRHGELEAVLAHEIGHYRKGHIPRMLALAAAMILGGFAALAWLARQDWFYTGFGFEPEPATLAPAFMLFGLLSGLATFWLTPSLNIMSRKHEYEADAFARDVIGSAEPLVAALRKLSEKNLSNLTPHPLYSGFYYSHPTLLEREAALMSEA